MPRPNSGRLGYRDQQLGDEMRSIMLAILLLLCMPCAAQEQHGVASFYGKKFHGRTMANGKPFDMWAMTAAHKTLPLGTVVLVTSKISGKVVRVEITDRGPYIKGRVIDLSRAAAEALGFVDDGLTEVVIQHHK